MVLKEFVDIEAINAAIIFLTVEMESCYMLPDLVVELTKLCGTTGRARARQQSHRRIFDI